MKRIFTIIAVLAMTLLMMAQTNQLVWSNGRLIYGTSVETIDSLTYGEMKDIDTLHLLLPRTIIKIVHDTVYIHDTVYVECPENPGETHEYVDLGLSVKWATCNIGAETPEEYGDYFAWAEVETKEKYNWVTYKYCNGSETTLTKYCYDNAYGTVDDKLILDSEDDAAVVNLGGFWRIPTIDEWTELYEKCNWMWVVQNGINGYKITGPSGNSIFLPVAGFIFNKRSYYLGTDGFYWTNSLHINDESKSSDASGVSMGSDKINLSYHGLRCIGRSIRPICLGESNY